MPDFLKVNIKGSNKFNPTGNFLYCTIYMFDCLLLMKTEIDMCYNYDKGK